MRKYLKRGAEVALWRPRYVAHVGYDTDFHYVLAKVLHEASPTYANSWGVERPKLIKDVVEKIIDGHPIFEGFRTRGRAACTAWLQAAEKGYRKDRYYTMRASVKGRMTDALEREMVRAFVVGQMDEAIQKGDRVRKIRFGELTPDIRAHDKPMCESWRGPWKIERVVRRLTGKYYPASGSGDDYEPAVLADVKHHTMYKVRSEGNLYGYYHYGRELLVLPEDTVPWEQYEDAKNVTSVVSEV